MPDVVLLYRPPRKPQPWLVLVEAVSSHGPMTPLRVGDLRRLLATDKAGLVFVTAFPDRATMVRYLRDIAWETEVWIAQDDTHLIHFNGDRFLGPHEVAKPR